MSILTIRSWFEKKGCIVALVVVMALIVAGLVLPQIASLFGVQGMGMDGNVNTKAFSLGGVEVTSEQLARAEEQVSRQMPAGATSPEMKLMQAGNAIQMLVSSAALESLAKKNGLSLSDEDLRKMFDPFIEDQITNLRFQLMINRTLKPDATDKDFEDFIKKQTGQDLPGFRKQQRDQLEAQLKLPDERRGLVQALLPIALNESYLKTASITEDEVKRGFDTLTVNKLTIPTPGLSNEERRKKLEEARQELISGKPFAEVHKKFTNIDAPPAQTLGRRGLEMMPGMEVLMTAKAKDVTPVIIEMGGMPAIYQVVKIESKVPADFDRTKVQLMDSARKDKARRKLEDEVKALTAPEKITWGRPVYSLIFRANKALSGGMAPAGRTEWVAIIDEAKKVQLEDASDMPAIVRYVATSKAFELGSAAEKADMKESRIETMQAVLQFMEVATIRLQLADLLAEAGRKEEASLELVTASQNVTAFDPASEAVVKDIEAKLKSFEDRKLIEKAQADDVRAALATYRKDRVTFQQEQDQIRKEAEAAQKQLEEEAKKMREEEAKRMKEEEAKKKAATGGGTGTGTAPATTGSKAPAPPAGGLGVPATTGGAAPAAPGR